MEGWQGLKPEAEMEPYEINYAVITDELRKHGQDIDSLRSALERADPAVFVEMVKVANENLSNPDALQKLGDTYAPNHQRLIEVKCLEASAEHLDMMWKFEVESGTFDARIFQEKLFLQTGFEFIINEFTHGSAEIVGSFVPSVVQDLATANQPAALVPALLMIAAGITGGSAIRAVLASQRLNNLMVASFVCACFGASIGYAACVRATVRTAQVGAQVGASGGPTGALVGGALGGISGFLLAYIL